MMTVVTHVKITEGQEPEWDAAMRDRVVAVKEQPGFVGVQLCIPLDAPDERVVIGTWETRAAWEAWHESEAFQATRKRMDRCEGERAGEWWHEVVLAERR
jgi:heme-degrading monooxygenase HmoA